MPYQTPVRRPDIVLTNKKKRMYYIMDFAVLMNNRVNMKKSEKQDKYLHLARELKIFWNMKVTVIPIIVGAFGTVPKGF